jgi:hypothetical protein
MGRGGRVATGGLGGVGGVVSSCEESAGAPGMAGAGAWAAAAEASNGSEGGGAGDATLCGGFTATVSDGGAFGAVFVGAVGKFTGVARGYVGGRPVYAESGEVDATEFAPLSW